MEPSGISLSTLGNLETSPDFFLAVCFLSLVYAGSLSTSISSGKHVDGGATLQTRSGGEGTVQGTGSCIPTAGAGAVMEAWFVGSHGNKSILDQGFLNHLWGRAFYF